MSPEQLYLIQYLLGQGLSVHVISVQMQCSEQCIRKWRARFVEEENGGREAIDLRTLRQTVPKLSDEGLKNVRQYLIDHPFTPVKALPQELDLNVNEKKIRRALNKRTNVKFCRPASKASLVQGDHQQRLTYAQNHVNWPMQRWRRTICLDEKVFSSA